MDNNSNNNNELVRALQSQITFLQQTVADLTRRVNYLEQKNMPFIQHVPKYPEFNIYKNNNE